MAGFRQVFSFVLFCCWLFLVPRQLHLFLLTVGGEKSISTFRFVEETKYGLSSKL
uniref:Uncharacterized protein n=1 Tax=Arundo donax TaxID=35708 RepID=A0A0A9BHY5_ARUDO